MVKGVIRQKEHLTTKTFLEEPTVVGKGMNKFLMKVKFKGSKVFRFGNGSEWLSALDFNSVCPGLNPQSGL